MTTLCYCCAGMHIITFIFILYLFLSLFYFFIYLFISSEVQELRGTPFDISLVNHHPSSTYQQLRSFILRLYPWLHAVPLLRMEAIKAKAYILQHSPG